MIKWDIRTVEFTEISAHYRNGWIRETNRDIENHVGTDMVIEKAGV